MCCASMFIPLYLFNISVSINSNMGGATLRHFLLQNKDNMILVSKCKLKLLLASSYRVRELKFLIHYLIHCSLSSYSNSLSRYPIQSTNRSWIEILLISCHDPSF
jgi:hypothetical protein